MAITSGAIPGARSAGARKDPCGEVSSIKSPCRIPRASAVRGLISTHEPHMAVVIGSGSSCIQGKLASAPSPKACVANGSKWKGKSDTEPSNSGGAKAKGACETGGETRSEEHTSELQSLTNLVCRL